MSSSKDGVGRYGLMIVLNVSDTDLKKLPEPLGKLRKLKAVVAMNNPWKEMDEGAVGNWTELNSLSESPAPFIVNDLDLTASRLALAQPHPSPIYPVYLGTSV